MVRMSKRDRLLTRHVLARGIRDPLVIAALKKVPREAFVPKGERRHAFEDRPLPIGGGQTISQPYIVAFMVEALELRGGEKVLEIGAGSGYAAAVLAEIAGEVYAVERIGELADKAALNLENAGYRNVHIRHADGTEGWPEAAAFDAILVSASAPAIPENFKSQLKVGGRLVIPVGASEDVQELRRVRRISQSEFADESIAEVRFVPLIGKFGWKES
jgi:protein-L-isoaspartate(D-aspartate) O-methyltransferase